MPLDIAPLIAPEHTGLVVFECQEGVIGDRGHLPGLASAVREGDVVARIAALIAGARRAGVRVFHCTLARRPDGVGAAFNTPLERRLHEARPKGTQVVDMGPVVAALAPQPEDVVAAREHGLTGFHESGLDDYLRNTGVRTLVLVGVSLNIGIPGTAIEAVNRGYAVVVPVDCVAADPASYAREVLQHTVRPVAWLVRSAEVLDAWPG